MTTTQSLTTTPPTETERLRAIDCAVERCRGRSKTDVYEHATSGRREWYWTYDAACGFRKPKVVPDYCTDRRAAMSILKATTTRFGTRLISASVAHPGAFFVRMDCDGEGSDVYLGSLGESICAVYVAACEAAKENE